MQVGDDVVLTLREAGELIGVSEETLRKQARRGVLRATLKGKTYLVTGTEAKRYKDEHKKRWGNYDHKTATRKHRLAPPERSVPDAD